MPEQMTVVNPDLVAEGLDPDYRGMPATVTSPWWIWLALAAVLYFVMGEE